MEQRDDYADQLAAQSDAALETLMESLDELDALSMVEDPMRRVAAARVTDCADNPERLMDFERYLGRVFPFQERIRDELR